MGTTSCIKPNLRINEALGVLKHLTFNLPAGLQVCTAVNFIHIFITYIALWPAAIVYIQLVVLLYFFIFLSFQILLAFFLSLAKHTFL